ncbi:hypothetical protein KAR91_62985 [Candidatus Pacearchaeota archaeon]|nr:hypothetical protein [Candidatus Pacearchaeota archaeon]
MREIKVFGDSLKYLCKMDGCRNDIYRACLRMFAEIEEKGLIDWKTETFEGKSDFKLYTMAGEFYGFMIWREDSIKPGWIPDFMLEKKGSCTLKGWLK